MAKVVEEAEIEGKTFRLESGVMARQADGAVLVSFGDTRVLCTVVCAPGRQELDYFPLRVDFEEKFYAGGKIPGGFFKREGKPSDEAILSARLIDRPIRPLFPKGYQEEVHIVATVLSADPDAPPEAAGILGASAALCLSPAPFQGPIAGVRVGMEGERIVVNPSAEVREEGPMDIVVAGTKDTVTMVEGRMREVPEEQVIQAIMAAHGAIRELIEFQERFVAHHEVEKHSPPPASSEEGMVRERVRALVWDRLPALRAAPGKKAREQEVEALAEEAALAVAAEWPEEQERIHALAQGLFLDVYREFVRRSVLEQGVRMDGRRPEDIRPITIQVGLLPRVHGSALFTRGETQSLGTCTLGATRKDAQIIDLMMAEGLKRFMLHYNFPPFSVGEAGRMGPPSRREVGHGHLAEGALAAVIPPEEEFPYIIRVVSEIMESNGSSSMASVCSGSLALWDAGVPIRRPVAGVAMGLVAQDGRHVILTDILGLEDQFGDMDFKVAGTRAGVTAFQLDVKTGGNTLALMREALARAREARLRILDLMEAALPAPRASLSPFAPALDVISINPDKIGLIIGPGGRTIRKIQEETKTQIDIEDDGLVKIVGDSTAAAAAARRMVEELTEEIEVGKTYRCRVVRIVPFGAFVELRPGVDGLIHISNLSEGYVERVEDVVKVGDEVMVEVIGTDEQGRPRLRLKELKEERPTLRAGDIVPGRVTNVVDYGVFVEIAPGVRGLVHRSRLGDRAAPHQVAKRGDRMLVEIVEIDDQGRYKLRRVVPKASVRGPEG